MNPNDVVTSAMKQPQNRALLILLSAESVMVICFLELGRVLQTPNYADWTDLPIIKCGVIWSNINII